MKAYDLFPQLGKASRAYNAAPLADYVVVQNGKLRYMARGMFVEVDTALPDLSLKASDLSTVVHWLIDLDDAEVSVESRDKTVIFSTRLNDYSTIVLSLNKPDTHFPHNSYYKDVDEIVLAPLLTNKYHFTIDAKMLQQAKKAFVAAGKHEDTSIPGITLSINGSVLTFAVNSINGAAKVVFRADDKAELPDSWEGEYTLETFMFTPYGWADEETPDVKFSFKDNERKELSPLMIEYEENVVVVLSPVWH